jgi:hypothetical protein
LLKTIVIAALIVLAIACGNESNGSAAAAPDSEDTNEFGFDVAMTAKPGSTFTIDDVKAVGWKSSKQLPADQLEGVSAVWFGYYQQKNLEVWIYKTHEDAVDLGTGPAGEIVEATRGVSGGGAGPYMKQTTHYGAYGVIGNLIVLCEVEVAVCESFANALP